MPIFAKTTAVKFSDSVAYTLLRAVFAIYFIFAVGITAYHMYLDYRTAETQIVKELGLIEKAFEMSLSTALFDLDAEQLKSILEGLHDMPALIGIKIHSSNPSIFIPDAARGRVMSDTEKRVVLVERDGSVLPTQTRPESIITHSFTLYQPGTKTEIARGELYSSSKVVLESVENSFIRLVVSAMVKTVLLWFLFLWAACGRLSFPLRQFSLDVEKINFDKPESIEPLCIKNKSSSVRNELTVLCDAFNTMMEKIQSHITEINNEKNLVSESSEIKSIFLNRMSHELRTPLNAIIGFSQLKLLDVEKGSEDEEQIQHILNAGEHLLQLVDDIMSVASFEVDAARLDIQPCDINEVVNQSLQEVKSLADVSGITIHTVPTALTAFANREKLLLVLKHLLSNAIKYTPARGTVTIDVHQNSHDVVFVDIIDTGVGLSHEDQQLIFNPFMRTDYAVDCGIEGVGLGLLIVKSCLQAMSGGIFVKSEPGQGSTFRIWLKSCP